MTDITPPITSFGRFSTDPSRPDYVHPLWRKMAARWQVVHDVRGGTEELRKSRSVYLQRFQAETTNEWNLRIQLTFAADHYAETLDEHVGLVTAEPPKLDADTPEIIEELTGNIDGAGNHLDVLTSDVVDSALHFGHVGILTDYPPERVATLSDERRLGIRPYVTLYDAPNIRTWRTARVGGARVLVQVMLREVGSEHDGEFGAQSEDRLRELRQEVFRDKATGRVRGLGRVLWRTWELRKDATGAEDYHPTGKGVLLGRGGQPYSRIPLRVIYGGRRLGTLYSEPHLLNLAYTDLEATQVQSDYANCMHKCNVPTPVFIGRDTTGGSVKMGAGLDLPMGAEAKFLEPTGVALRQTAERLAKLEEKAMRQGATGAESGSGAPLTATEARLIAAQRNAKLRKAATSTKDGLDGVLADMAEFVGLGREEAGTVEMVRDFVAEERDPAYLRVLVEAYKEGAVSLDALIFALETGRLPEDYSNTDAALRLIAETLASDEPIREGEEVGQ